MKVGDLVRCIWQPGSAGVCHETNCCLPMKHTIKGELGLIAGVLVGVHGASPRYHIAFPQLGYAHALSDGAFEVISENP